MSETIQTIAALVAIAAAAIGVGSWAWHKRVTVRRWFARQAEAVDAVEQESEAQQLDTLRGQVADRARALGIVLAERSLGSGRIVNTQGETLTYIRDHGVYSRAMQAGTVDRFRTWPGAPPRALDQQDRAWLEKWLEDHSLDGQAGSVSEPE